MKTYKAKEYYASQQDYYLDNQNVADCKLQLVVGDNTIYGLDNNATQFMDNDTFYTDTELDEVINYLT